MPEAKVLIDSVGYKPFPEEDDPTSAKARLTQYAAQGETVELSEGEYKRLEAIGAVGPADSETSRDEAAAAMTAGGVAQPHQDFGPPLPGQQLAQVAELAAERVLAEVKAMLSSVAPEAYPLMTSADNESEAQREAREASDEAGREAAAASAEFGPGEAPQTDTAESPRGRRGSGGSARAARSSDDS